MSRTARTVPSRDMNSFHNYLKSSYRILAVCGAGLSASSGLPTFRGAGGMWRTYQAMDLATPQAFARDPGLVWQFYSARRHAALSVSPNAAHYALAAAAKNHRSFVTATQNVDGLSVRAGHLDDKILYLHGSLFTIKCSDEFCGYVEKDNFQDPLVPALKVAEPIIVEGVKREEWPEVRREDLPVCPQCRTALLRPGVVWFSEDLPEDVIVGIEEYLAEPVDLCLVVGTSGKVFPAAGYAARVRGAGGKVAVVDMDATQRPEEADWIFEGDAAKLIPELLEPIIGKPAKAD